MRAQLLALMCVLGCAKQGATPGPNESSRTGETGNSPGASGTMLADEHGLVAPAVPVEIAIPDGNKLTFIALAKGVQIYACAANPGGAPAWKLHAPRADLLDDAGLSLGSHYGGVDKGLPPGPYWEHKDGSRVHGAKPVNAGNAGSIPLLRLEGAEASGSGELSKVSFIQRLDTTGGVAPAGACSVGETTEVPYTATYYFYSKP